MSTGTSHSRSAKLQFWQSHITDWRSSGLSQKLYCLKHGLAVQTFGYWHRKLKQETENRPPRFFPIAVTTVATPASVEQDDSYLVVNVCNSRFSIKVGGNFDGETLRKLILSLEAMPCSDQARM